ncbi:hypothetical protein QBC39DRAFT_130372 [Podospora conica]|nr:hypothetical protein QBC39DRAFT_130372 [Schizothecium conicum]
MLSSPPAPCPLALTMQFPENASQCKDLDTPLQDNTDVVLCNGPNKKAARAGREPRHKPITRHTPTVIQLPSPHRKQGLVNRRPVPRATQHASAHRKATNFSPHPSIIISRLKLPWPPGLGATWSPGILPHKSQIDWSTQGPTRLGPGALPVLARSGFASSAPPYLCQTSLTSALHAREEGVRVAPRFQEPLVEYTVVSWMGGGSLSQRCGPVGASWVVVMLCDGSALGRGDWAM